MWFWLLIGILIGELKKPINFEVASNLNQDQNENAEFFLFIEPAKKYKKDKERLIHAIPSGFFNPISLSIRAA